MTVAKAREKILLLMDESTSGTEYDDRIYAGMDMIQTELATMVKPIETVDTVASVDGKFTKPADLFEIVTIYDEDRDVAGYHAIGETVYIPDGEYTLVYNKYPSTIISTSTAFEVDEECQLALVYGVAALLTYDESAYSIFELKAANIKANIASRERTTVRVTGGMMF